MSGDVGAIAGAVNVAIADNDARNEAKLLGAASADNVFVEAWLQSGAPASLHGLNIGAISVGVGTLVSVDRAQNLAAVENGDLRANSLQVVAQADPPRWGERGQRRTRAGRGHARWRGRQRGRGLRAPWRTPPAPT